MGCCFSSHGKLKPQSRPQHGGSALPETTRAAVSDRAPPPSLEQEHVKQVLSETPLPNLHHQVPHGGDRHLTQKMAVVSEIKIEGKLQIEKLEEVVEEVSCSQVSEMCSLSESFSTATTLTEKRDDEVVSKPSADSAQRVSRARSKVTVKRSYAGNLAGGKERVPKSPARRTDPSPERKVQAGTRSTRTRQQNEGSIGVRRDSGEVSGRRSRSPMTRAAGGLGRGGVGRSPMKQTGKAGSRSQNAGVAQSPCPSQSMKGGTPNDDVSQQNGNESLVNPHVSLECFIFL